MSEHKTEISTNNEKKTLLVIIFTIITMIAEIIYGYATNSMALTADGYHMATHALALTLTYVAYILTRHFSNSDLFQNGTEKIGTLTAYTSSLFLGFTGFWIIFEVIERLINPQSIKFDEAILVAIIGLIVNTLCIFIMEGGEHKHHTHDEKEGTDEDYNFKSAYYHILADALTSVLAISALVIGKYFNITYLDSLTGIFGGILIINWAKGLLINTIKILVDVRQ